MKGLHKSLKACLMEVCMIYVLMYLAFSLKLLNMQIYKRSMLGQEVVEFFLHTHIFKSIVGDVLIIPGYNMSRGTID